MKMKFIALFIVITINTIAAPFSIRKGDVMGIRFKDTYNEYYIQAVDPQDNSVMIISTDYNITSCLTHKQFNTMCAYIKRRTKDHYVIIWIKK